MFAPRIHVQLWEQRRIVLTQVVEILFVSVDKDLPDQQTVTGRQIAKIWMNVNGEFAIVKVQFF